MIGFRCLKVKLSQDDGVAASDKRTAGVREEVIREQVDSQQSSKRGDDLKSKLQTLCIRHIWMGEAGNSTKRPDSSWMARLGKLNSKSYLVEDCTCNVPILVK